MSILTQFHFQYLWNTLFIEKLTSSAELDMMGIDAIMKLNNMKVGIQVKKVSYRREASSRRFTKRQQKYIDVIVEVPYLVINIEELKDKLQNPRVRQSTKIKCQTALDIFNKNFIRFLNGFVVFKKEYLNHIYQVILEKIKTTGKGRKISYNEILTW